MAGLKTKSSSVLSNTDKIVQVASTLAIEEMYVGKDIIQNLIAIGNKEKTVEECIKELDKKYGR